MTTMAQYREEYDTWRTFLNREITYFMAGAGASIIALPKYEGLVLVVFILVAVMTHSSGKFPRLLKNLQQKKRSRSENYKYHGIIKTDFGFRALCTGFLPYTLACVFLTSILAGVWS